MSDWILTAWNTLRKVSAVPSPRNQWENEIFTTPETSLCLLFYLFYLFTLNCTDGGKDSHIFSEL